MRGAEQVNMLQATSDFTLPICQIEAAKCLVIKAVGQTHAFSAAERSADQAELPSLSTSLQEC